MWRKKNILPTLFGITEHFKQLTLSSVEGFCVILFDESLNKKMQEKQTDIHVCYWGTEINEVVTRYLGSQFLGHATANDMVKHFKEAIVDKMNVSDLIMPPFNKVGVYCFANVGPSVGLSCP